MNESQLQIIYNYTTYPTDSTTQSDRRFVNIDDGSEVGTHWCCFIIKDIQSFYFDPFVGQPDKFFLNHLP